MNNKRALVTGCCGFIGSHLTRTLLSMGWDVEGVDDTSSGNFESLTGVDFKVVPADVLHIFDNQDYELGDSVLLVHGDIAHENVLSRVKSGIYDVVFHMAAVSSVKDSLALPVETFETNVFKTVALFQASVGNVGRVVFASSAAVYGNADCPVYEDTPFTIPSSPYGLHKLQCEQTAELFGTVYDLDVVSLRYFNVYGPGQVGSALVASWCNSIRNSTPLLLEGDGNQTRDFCFIDDVVDATITAANYVGCFAGRAYNVATGKSTSNNEILAYLCEKYPHIKVENKDWRPGDITHSTADVTRLSQELDYTNTVDFFVGLDETLKWWELD